MEGDYSYIDTKEKEYPLKIKTFVRDPKPLYYRGDIKIMDCKSIGIIGSRRCSAYGLAVAKEIAKRSVEHGLVVISGLAKGIDAQAHKTALDNKGKTVGVLGCGIDIVYPSENKHIYREMSESGLLISEYPPGTPPHRYNFPTRNRLISALSDVIVVVEAGTRSGSLITAECAIEQGKEVYGVPGNITSILSMGPNKLIRDGARALALIDDLFLDMGIKPKLYVNQSDLGADEAKIYEIISGGGEIPIGELSQKAGMEMSKINGILTILEIKGLIICEMGKVMIANFT